MQIITTDGERRIRIAIQNGVIVVHNLDTSDLIVERPCYGFERHLADEIERLKENQK
jgi:hypothetical protein